MNKSMKILVTGVKGQLGYDCVRELKERGYTNVLGIDKETLDITDEEKVLSFIKEYKPDVVMHNAAWTAVDKAEEMKDLVYKVNALGPKYIAKACKEVGAKMVYISTDYVFDGKGETPFEVDSPKNGLSTYGKTKGEGEDFVTSILDKYFIVRISWVFGVNGNNFVKTMLKLADMGKTELNVVCDQIGSVTYTYDLSKLLCDMIETTKYGIYHATNEGYISWADFAREIFKLSNKNVKVNDVTTFEYKKLVPNQTDRPLNSRMSKDSLDKAGFNRLPDWKDALKRYLKELSENV
jgi:dTDP-4-dehydrorhamnose reductase